MVELKVAAKETVKITFGGSGGWAPCDYTVTQDDLSHLRQLEHDVEVVRSDSQAMQVRLASATRERDSYKDDNTKLGNENDSLAETIARQTAEITRLREVCCRPLPPAAGTPVYMIDQKLADTLKDVSENMVKALAKESEWRPIATALKDESYILLRLKCGDVVCARFASSMGRKWMISLYDEKKPHKAVLPLDDCWEPTHWMPLPEPPR